jgi:hypothetical protein
MGHRIAIAENYPHLKADQNFRDLKNQLASPPTHVTNWSTDHCRHSIRTSDRRHLRGDCEVRALLAQVSHAGSGDNPNELPDTLIQRALTRIIHEASAVSADTRLRRAVSPFSPSTYCTSMPQGFTAPSARLASRLHAFATNLYE